MAQCPTCGRGGGIQRKEAVVAYSDGRIVRYRVTPGVELHFERTYGKTIGSLTDGAQEDAYNLVWEAMKASHKGEVVPSVTGWLETVEAATVKMVDVVPLDSQLQPDTSQASQSLSEPAPVS